MKILTFSNNYLQMNTYILMENSHGLIIDPGSNTKEILKLVDKYHLTIDGIILTHAHFDHFMGANELNLLLDVPLHVHQGDVPLLNDATKNISKYVPEIKPVLLDPSIQVIPIQEQTLEIGAFRMNVFHTPGHSKGGICLYFSEDTVVFTGDTLFNHGIGRTDLLNGNEKQLITNIKAKLFKLPDSTICYPGHGNETTIGIEKRENIYLR